MKKILYMGVVVLIAGLGGCCKQNEKTQTAAMEPSGCPRIASVEGTQRQTAIFPGRTANMVRLERIVPREVVAGQQFDYDILVSNLTYSTLNDITVTENLSDSYQFQSAAPEGKIEGRQLTWNLPELGPKASQKITITGVAQKSGRIAQCADIRYKMPACGGVDVVAPQLGLSKTMPGDSLLCDKIPIKYTVTNTGTGIARNVIITDKLPDGLLTLDGGNLVALDSCPLGAGQSQEFSVMVRAKKPGEYTSTAIANADGDLKAQADGGMLKVHEPLLSIVEKGPEKESVGRPIRYEITVTNNGDGAASKTIIQKQIPSDAKFVSATEDGSFSNGTVTWDIGTLQPGTSKKVEFVYTSDVSGAMKTTTEAIAECSTTATSSSVTEVSGVPEGQ